MSQNPNNRNSLLLCFQEIIKMMPQAGDLNAFLSALENVEDPQELCLKLANKLRLAPESRGDVTIEELASFFGAPIFLQLNNGNWVLYLGIRKLLQGGVQQERYAVFENNGVFTAFASSEALARQGLAEGVPSTKDA